MRGTRGLLLALLLCVVGSAIVLGATGRPWVRREARVSSPTPERPDAFVTTTSERTGADVAPGVRALGLVSLAGGAALLGSRGRGRQVVGAVLASAGVGTAYLAVRVDHAGRTGAVATAAAAGLVVAAGGMVTMVNGSAWPALGARYERSETAPRDRDELADTWEALDRGEDVE